MNRRELLVSCLERYRTQTLEGIEVIVADNGSSDDTTTFLRANVPDVTVVRFEENVGPLALNAAAEAAHGELLWRTDDDAYPETDTTLEEAVAFLDAHPDVVAVTGEVIEPNRGNAVLNYYPFTIPEQGIGPDGLPINEFHGVTTMLRREAFLRVGGFWDVFYLEELDCATRLILDGGGIRYVPWIRTVHLQDFVQNRAMDRRWLWQSEQTIRYQWRYFPWWLAAYRSGVVLLGTLAGGIWHRFGPRTWWRGLKGIIRGMQKGLAEHIPLNRAQRDRITFGRSIWDYVFAYYIARVRARKTA